MCGICGIYHFQTNLPADAETVRSMAAAIAHRGPDDEGFYFDGPLGLGFRRLSIIDLDAGRQPMSDPLGRIWVVFNGEIYNHLDLREQLEQKGHRFRTRCDTEVIVHGYAEWGDEVFERLNGMFGIGLWDRSRQRLILARDRLGIKPLYFANQNGALLFGSEIHPLLDAWQGAKPRIDPEALYQFLKLRYTPSPRTLYCGIQKLAPGTRLIVEKGSCRVERWWNFRPEPFDPMPSWREAKERLLELYLRAVERHLISDVPLGILLSGGVDSALLLALMARFGKGWNAYTVGFSEPSAKDEVEAARFTARFFGARSVEVRLDRQEFVQSMPEVIGRLEEPVAASSIVPMYHLCRRAARDVKVVLVGQGPDELFGGYLRHLGIRYGSCWRALPAWLRAAAGKAFAALSSKESVRRSLFSLDRPEREDRFIEVFSLLSRDKLQSLFRKETLPSAGEWAIRKAWSEIFDLAAQTGELGAFQALELRSSLPDELLLYGDKLSMAHGLEARVPYLDHEIVEYVERLDPSYKVRWGRRKWLHRALCRDLLPNEIIQRKKLGFETPVGDWFKTRLDAVLLAADSPLYDHLDPDAVQGLAREHRQGASDHGKILFSLFALEEWLKGYGAGRSTAAHDAAAMARS